MRVEAGHVLSRRRLIGSGRFTAVGVVFERALWAVRAVWPVLLVSDGKFEGRARDRGVRGS